MYARISAFALHAGARCELVPEGDIRNASISLPHAFDCCNGLRARGIDELTQIDNRGCESIPATEYDIPLPRESRADNTAWMRARLHLGSCHAGTRGMIHLWPVPGILSQSGKGPWRRKFPRNVRGMFPYTFMRWKELNGQEGLLLRNSEMALTNVLRLVHRLCLGWEVDWLGNVEQPLVP